MRMSLPTILKGRAWNRKVGFLVQLNATLTMHCSPMWKSSKNRKQICYCLGGEIQNLGMETSPLKALTKTLPLLYDLLWDIQQANLSLRTSWTNWGKTKLCFCKSTLSIKFKKYTTGTLPVNYLVCILKTPSTNKISANSLTTQNWILLKSGYSRTSEIH